MNEHEKKENIIKNNEQKIESEGQVAEETFQAPLIQEKSKKHMNLFASPTQKYKGASKYFLEHPKKGALTEYRERAGKKKNRLKAIIPSKSSGITIGPGIDFMTYGMGKSKKKKLLIILSLDISSRLGRWILNVPSRKQTNEENKKWLKNNPMPIALTKEQYHNLYLFAKDDQYLPRAKRRLMGETGTKMDKKIRRQTGNKRKFTEEEWDNLGVNKDDDIYDFLADLAWNSAHFANNNRHKIAKALRVTSLERDGTERTEIDRKIKRYKQLYAFVKQLRHASGSGKKTRLAWLYLKLNELQSKRNAKQSIREKYVVDKNTSRKIN